MTWWTKDRQEKAKALWAEGKSASEIGDILHTSRNAVISKLWRMGCSQDRATGQRKMSAGGRANAQRIAAVAMIQRQLEQREDRAKWLQGPPSPRTPPYVEPAPDTIVPVEKRKGIIDLGPDDCKWPIGDPQQEGFHFCDGVRVLGQPYCSKHVAKAYAPAHPIRPVPVANETTVVEAEPELVDV